MEEKTGLRSTGLRRHRSGTEKMLGRHGAFSKSYLSASDVFGFATLILMAALSFAN
jgi:hypothetical protein